MHEQVFCKWYPHPSRVLTNYWTNRYKHMVTTNQTVVCIYVQSCSTAYLDIPIAIAILILFGSSSWVFLGNGDDIQEEGPEIQTRSFSYNMQITVPQNPHDNIDLPNACNFSFPGCLQNNLKVQTNKQWITEKLSKNGTQRPTQSPFLHYFKWVGSICSAFHLQVESANLSPAVVLGV